MPLIFISYRRDDEPGFTGRLVDALEKVFGADVVFRDREDIRAGDDFVAVIEEELRQFAAMLVVIGPGWLATSRDGVRRLDAAGDFVEFEVRRGLASGKPVIPVLVGGATMPAASDLPPALAGLARRQAVVLADASWAADIAHLVELLRGLLAAQRPPVARRAWRLAAALLAALVVALIAVALLAPQFLAGGKPDAGGRWHAHVVYDWGDAYDETYDLQVAAGEVRGSATYLGLARRITQGELRGERISFSTRSSEVLGGEPPREVTHHYRGRFSGGALQLTLETSGGYTQHSAIDFVARRPR